MPEEALGEVSVAVGGLPSPLAAASAVGLEVAVASAAVLVASRVLPTMLAQLAQLLRLTRSLTMQPLAPREARLFMFATYVIMLAFQFFALLTKTSAALVNQQ